MSAIVGATQGLVRSNSMPDFGKVASDIQEDYLNAPIISIITPISPIIIPKDPQK